MCKIQCKILHILQEKYLQDLHIFWDICHAMFTCTSRAHSLAFKSLCNPSLNMLPRFGTLTWLKTFKCLRLFKSVLLGGYTLNETMIPIPDLKLLRVFCKNFTGEALPTDVTIYVLYCCLILYTRGILHHYSFKNRYYSLRYFKLSLQCVNTDLSPKQGRSNRSGQSGHGLTSFGSSVLQ